MRLTLLLDGVTLLLLQGVWISNCLIMSVKEVGRELPDVEGGILVGGAVPKVTNRVLVAVAELVWIHVDLM